jgi:phosphotransferase system enzyme I (PtsP)
VVRSIDRTARAAETAGIEISACGEMAHETHYAPLLLGLGIRTLSVDPHYLQPVQQALEGWTLEQARALAADVRKETTLDGAARRLGLSQAEGCQAGSPPAGPAAE